MPAEILNIILFLIFEFLVIFTAIRIVYLITKNNKKNYSRIELVLGWISVSLILTSIIPSIFSFLKYNGIWQYFTIIVLICLILHLSKKSELIKYKNFLVIKFNNIFDLFLDWRFLVTVAIIVPFFLVRIAPMSNTDDLYTLNFAFEWIFNQQTPYHRAFTYVPFWEISFLPSLVISSTDNFLWLNSFKTLIIIGLGTYLIGKSINLPKFLIWASVLSSILFFKLWGWGVFLGTLKNDFIFAAGIILIILTLVRTTQVKPTRLYIIFFIMGIVFITTKYSGILLSTIAILFFIFINRNIILENKKNVIKWITITGLVFLGTTGHYYLYNFLEFGNPFYPGQLNFLGIELPGAVDWSNTSILANANNEKLFSIFFPTNTISIGGIFFPAIIIFGFLGTGAIIIYGLFKFLKRKKIEISLFIIASFLLITWMLYLATPFSGGTPDGDLNYFNELNSTRYILGSIFVTEILFIGILWRIKIHPIAILSFIAINAISRYVIVVNKIQYFYDISIILIIIPFIVLLGLFIIGKKVTKFSTRMVAVILIAIVIFVVTPQIVEENRAFWILSVQNVALSVHNLPPSEIFVIDEPGIYKYYRTYYILGDQFQHSIKMGGRAELFTILSQENEINKIPEYVTMICKRNIECEDSITEFKFDMEKNGFEEMARDKHAIIFKLIN